jgi:uncharacterized delta-60 repeat protein
MDMTKRPHFAVSVLVCIATVALSGCSGGGNGSGGGSSPSPIGSASAFNQARGFNDPVTSIVPVSDGSADVFVAGSFTTYTDVVSNRLIRLHADGTVAQAFPDGFNDAVVSLVAARDTSGAMYALGWFTQFNGQPVSGFIRLNRDGSRDTSFQLAAMDRPPTTVAPIPDGSGAVYIGGSFTNYGGTAIRHLARLRPNGTLDPSFNPGAGFTGLGDGSGPGSTVMAVARMAVEEIGSRRLYVSGIFGTYRGTSVAGFVRILPSGEIDPTFVMGTGPGVVINSAVLPAEALLPAADGKIYVGGILSGWNGESASQGLVRVNENGSLDRSFVPTPLTTVMIGPAGDTTGDIYVSGSTFSSSAPYVLRRLRPDGSPTPSFQEALINQPVITVTSVADGSADVYAGGYFTAYAGNGVNHFARVRPDGTLAASTVRGSGFKYDVYDVESGGEGAVYVVTSPAQSYNGTAIRPLVRLLPNGTLDPSFLFRENVIPGSGVIISSVTRARNDNRIYVTGRFAQYDGSPVASVMRLFPDGTLDRAFVSGQGFRQVDRSGSDFMADPNVVPAASPAGTVYAFGHFNVYKGTPVLNFVRLTSSGTLDSGFAIGSGFEGGILNPFSTVVPNEDGSIYVSGFFNTFNGEPVPGIVRLDSTGRRDRTFVPPEGVKVQTIAGDGSPFVIGRVYPTTRLQKLRRDGSVDPTFNPDAVPGAITQVFMLSNDRLAVVGVFGTDPNPTQFPLRGYVMLFDQAGRQVSMFGLRTLNSVLTTPFAIAEADDGTGDIYLGGAFTRYENQTMQRIARLNSDGSAD